MIIPILFAGGFPTQRLDDALVRATGSGVHVSELDIAIQPVLTIALTIAVFRLVWLAARRRVSTKTLMSRWPLLALLFVSVWIALETTLARGFIYPLLHHLPVFESMHVNHRVASVFVLPITIAAAIAINAWPAHRRPAVSALLLTAALLFQASYELLPEQFYRRWTDITPSEQAHRQVRAGERFPITRVDEILEDRVFEQRASSRTPYEPLFGYDNQYFKAETRDGPINDVRDGYFNLTNPASLIFPELNGLRPFERIRADDAENLRRFVNRERPQWRHPPVLDWLNRLAVITLVLCIAVLGRNLIDTVRKSRRHGQPA